MYLCLCVSIQVNKTGEKIFHVEIKKKLKRVEPIACIDIFHDDDSRQRTYMYVI